MYVQRAPRPGYSCDICWIEITLVTGQGIQRKSDSFPPSRTPLWGVVISVKQVDQKIRILGLGAKRQGVKRGKVKGKNENWSCDLPPYLLTQFAHDTVLQTEANLCPWRRQTGIVVIGNRPGEVRGVGYRTIPLKPSGLWESAWERIGAWGIRKIQGIWIT